MIAPEAEIVIGGMRGRRAVSVEQREPVAEVVYEVFAAFGFLVGAPAWEKREHVRATDVAAATVGGLLYSAWVGFGSLDAVIALRDSMLGTLLHNNAVLMLGLDERGVYRVVVWAARGTPLQEVVEEAGRSEWPLEALLPRLSGKWKPSMQAAQEIAPPNLRNAAPRLAEHDEPPEKLRVIVNELASENKDVLKRRVLKKILEGP